MQSSTGCRINVSSQFHPSDTEREISLQGPKDAITRARKAIEDKVEASVCSSSHVICPIPEYSSPPFILLKHFHNDIIYLRPLVSVCT